MNIQDALRALNPNYPEHWTADGMPRVDKVAELTNNPDLTRADITAADPEFTREKSLRDQVEKLAAEESPKTDPSAVADEAPAEGVSDPAEAVEQPTEAELMAAEPKPEAATLLETVEQPADPETVEQPADPEAEALFPLADPMHPAADPMEPEAEPEVLTVHEREVAPIPEPEDALTPIEQLHREVEASAKEMYTAQGIAKEAKTEADAAADRVNALNRKIEVLEKADPHHDTRHIRDYLAQQRRNREIRAGRMSKFLGDSGVALKDVSKELDPRAPLDRAMHGRKPPRGTTRPVYTRTHPR